MVWAAPARLAGVWRAPLHRPTSTESTRTQVRLHLAGQVDDIDAGRREVESLGGGWTGERHDYDEGVVVVCRDPEGHEFCLVQFYE